ncbi:hypothetical protein [Ferrovibrio sp.]|uniref:hypothetical protein n=1 Tax=Ferrovibrio sp. TaxID=1917215 RepID=UPI0035AF5883
MNALALAALELLPKGIAVLSTFALAFMGARVSLKPVMTENRNKWLIAFAVIGFANVMAAHWESERQEKNLETRLTGGDNYVYLRVDEGDLAARKEWLRTWICSTGHMFDVKIHPHPFGINSHNDPNYFSMRGPEYSYVGTGCRLSPIPVRVGKFWIDFDARNGLIVQTLEIIAPPDGPFTQACSLPRNGVDLPTPGCPSLKGSQ